MKKILITFFIFSVISAFSMEFDPLALFLERLSLEKSLSFKARIEFSLIDTSTGTETDIEFWIGINFLTSDFSDWYLEITAPEELSGIAFVFLERENVLFSIIDKKPWKQYRTMDDFTLLGNFLAGFFGGLTDPKNFDWKKVENSNEISYYITPNESKLRFMGLLRGGGYIPNIMKIVLGFEMEPGRFPLPESILLTDRLERESVRIQFEEFKFDVVESFNTLREIYYSTFR
ncbi:hypothetical protein AT15_08975 [Kosmotoga arenicorallina S304]|uniref:Outer membrane lipoprotein-sorting protein n=1 Tax=Kosmotoga arenicorallina S304 TaxID=1453497 RepID=A0A176K1S6_9BACT|nr:hypothetical protein [Kosmotoga arenicorallina]OAA31098.1 hypothetical protein AT15_08975 [Kosmotoga arenicorallina S304]